MTREIFGQLPAREVVGTDHAVHDAGFLEDDEIAVHRALREVAAPGEDLGDRERTGRGREGVDQRLTVGSEALPHTVKTRRRRLAHVFGTRGHGRRLYRRPLPSVSWSQPSDSPSSSCVRSPTSRSTKRASSSPRTRIPTSTSRHAARSSTRSPSRSMWTTPAHSRTRCSTNSDSRATRSTTPIPRTPTSMPCSTAGSGSRSRCRCS